jgi:acetyl coenzyme A synthetase (ADP forming)-like protein
MPRRPTAFLDELFRPRSVAVLGASNRPDSVGTSLFRNVLSAGFQGVVYPVNPSWPSVSGVRCYRSVGDLPEVPDLGIVIVPAPAVRNVVEELGRAGTKGVVVISAGFREVGGDGVAREAELVATARRHKMSLVGPNCFGVLNTDPTVGLNATFSDDLPPRGNIAFVSQSGALCAGILRYGIAERIGFSRFVSIGNRAGIDENDLLRSLADDPATGVVLLYIENLADGHRFLETAREVTEKKPVIVIKSGRSVAGERAARSHTGSLAHAAQDRLYGALFEQSGVLRVDSIGELFRAAKVHAARFSLAGPRVAILTNSGGPGIVAADACARVGLELPAPSPATVRSLRGRLSPSASVSNPLDMTADANAKQYTAALAGLLASPTSDGSLVIATPTGTLSGEAVSNAILAGRGKSHKPVVACLFGLTDLSHEVGVLEERGVPTFTFPEEAVAALGTLAKYHAWKTRPRTKTRTFRVDRPAVRAAISAARRSGTPVLPEYTARALLEAYGIIFAPSRRASDLDGALQAASKIGYPVVLKVASPDISHKTDVGGVAANLADEAGLRAAWATMQADLARRAPGARVEGFEVESMIRGGHEVLVGAQRDPSFGPVVVFGMGGIYVEVLQDVTFRLAPLRPLSAVNMVASVRSAAILNGVRGEGPGDLASLYEVIQRVSQLIVEVPELSELDLNPMIVRPTGQGVVAVDARVVLDLSSKSARPASRAR